LCIGDGFLTLFAFALKSLNIPLFSDASFAAHSDVNCCWWV